MFYTVYYNSRESPSVFFKVAGVIIILQEQKKQNMISEEDGERNRAEKTQRERESEGDIFLKNLMVN